MFTCKTNWISAMFRDSKKYENVVFFLFFLVFPLIHYINHICTDVELTHLTKEMFEKAVKFLLLFMGQPHTGGHLISCRGMDTTCQH